MGTAPLIRETHTLIELLHNGEPISLGAIPWASPVVSFGDPAKSSLATLGLNPSNLEFVDSLGNQLIAPYNRFESLATLGTRHWGNVENNQAEAVWQACKNYFYKNPYDRWFKRLEKIFLKTGASYYSRAGRRACHLDLVPYATNQKWSALNSNQRARLIQIGAPSLVRTIKASKISVLVLNGSSVVREFNSLLGIQKLKSRSMPSWSLQGGRVLGVAHIGRISALMNIPLDREILVLGYNHNIQSSFGVTTEVVNRIATWVARNAEGNMT